MPSYKSAYAVDKSMALHRFVEFFVVLAACQVSKQATCNWQRKQGTSRLTVNTGALAKVGLPWTLRLSIKLLHVSAHSCGPPNNVAHFSKVCQLPFGTAPHGSIRMQRHSYSVQLQAQHLPTTGFWFELLLQSNFFIGTHQRGSFCSFCQALIDSVNLSPHRNPRLFCVLAPQTGNPTFTLMLNSQAPVDKTINAKKPKLAKLVPAM